MSIKTAFERDYYAARREHVFLLHLEGLTYRTISERLGVHPSCARQLMLTFRRKFKRSVKYSKWTWIDHEAQPQAPLVGGSSTD